MTSNSFDARGELAVGNTKYEIFRLDAVDGGDRLPYSLKVLLENLLRNEDGRLAIADRVLRQLLKPESDRPPTL